MNQYEELIKNKEQEQSKYPFMFSTLESMEKELKEKNINKDKVKFIADGHFYIIQEHVDKINEIAERYEQEIKVRMEQDVTGENFIKDMFKYVLKNEEYGYTLDASSSLKYLGYTADEINSNTKLKNGLELAKKEILREEEEIEISRKEKNIRELHSKLASYDLLMEETQKQWREIHNLKPEEMSDLEFQDFIQQIRLDNKLIDSFLKDDPYKCKSLIYEGANKDYLYKYVLNSEIKLSIVQKCLLQDLHNTRRERHFPYVYDREICDTRTITKEKYDELLSKFNNKEKFTFDELDCFLLENSNNQKYIALDNTTGNMWTEEFKEKEYAERYLKGERIENLREEESKNDRYKYIIQCELQSNDKTYKNQYLLVRNLDAFNSNFEIDLTGDFCFNCDYKVQYPVVVKTISKMKELLEFCTERNINIPKEVVRKNGFVVGGKDGLFINENLEAVGWVEELGEIDELEELGEQE